MAFFDFLKIFSSDKKPQLKKSVSKDELEESLIEADLDYEIIEKILDSTPSTITPSELEVALLRFFRGESYYDRLSMSVLESSPQVFLIMGVNGAGKTTTIAKLARRFKNEGKKVILVAADTFRAAAIEQLSLWSERLGVDIVKSQYGADPSSVAFDGVSAAKSRGADVCIIDTAGRLHNQTNLKNELLKIAKTTQKALDGEFYKLLVLDGTQGGSALNQAKIFHETLSIDGVVITKLDGTSKGGAILSIYHGLKIPIYALGVGEGEGDLVDFSIEDFISAIISYVFKL